jgi:hypothetical protein
MASVAVKAENQSPTPTPGNSSVQKPCDNCQGHGGMGKGMNGQGQKGKGMRMSPEDQQAMQAIREKYKNNPEFKTMMTEIKTTRENIMKQYKPNMDSFKAENQKMKADFKAKMEAAKTDEEKAKVKEEIKTAINANKEKRQAQMAPMKQAMDTQMGQIKTKYQSKFPDFFALTDKMKAQRQNRPNKPNAQHPGCTTTK